MPSSSQTETSAPMSSTTDSSGKSGARRTRWRRDSSLGADPRGDTGATAIATSNLKQNTPPQDSPTSPVPRTKERGRKRRKAKRVLSRWKRIALRHTWLLPLILTLVILGGYFVSPGEHNPLHPAIFLSYANPPLHERTNTLPAHIGNVTQYGKGPKDFAFVAFYTIVLSFTREFLMQRLIRPLALRWGIRNKGKLSRFMEQFYTALYFAIFGPFGLFVMSRTPVWYFNTAGMYEGFPHRAHEAYFKAYYLLQASYWAQQGLVLLLQLEKPRKDFRELILHHVITVALIGLSYRFHFTYMGVAVYVTHDISDFFLATSKVLNYLDSIFTPPYFVVFMGIWAYLRHFINLRILYSMSPFRIPGFPGTPNEFKNVGPYATTWEDIDFPNQQYKCHVSQRITFSLLACLQAVNMFWFFLICRILVRLLFKGIAKDERSDDEEEGEEDMVEKEKNVAGEVNGKAVKPNGVANGGLEKSANGHPIGDASAIEVEDRKATLRKR